MINKLDDLGLAMWYADDGSTVLVQYNPSTKSARSRRAQICTDSFSKEEHDNIILPELKQLGLTPSYVERDSHYRVTLKDLKKVQKMLEHQRMSPNMEIKFFLSNNPVLIIEKMLIVGSSIMEFIIIDHHIIL